MEIIRWQDIYEVHVEEIDRQHRKLVGLVNTMATAMKAGRGKTVVAQVLSELVDYTAYHFETEEKYLRQYDCPGYEAHKQMHRDLTSRAASMKNALDQGSPVVTTHVLMFLSEWLNKHIVEEDRKIGSYIAAGANTAKAS